MIPEVETTNAAAIDAPSLRRFAFDIVCRPYAIGWFDRELVVCTSLISPRDVFARRLLLALPLVEPQRKWSEQT